MKKPNKKIFIVTGCTGGIGNAVCRRLNNEDSIIIGINQNKLKRSGYVHDQFSFDLGSADETEYNINTITWKYGPPDCLIHCCGSLIPGYFNGLSFTEIKSVADANFFSLLHIIKAVQPSMQKRRKGHIVVVGSLGGIIPMPYSALYSSTKFAVRGFCLSLAEEMKDKGISVSLISPGSVDTGMLKRESSDDNAVISFMQKPISPEQVAERITAVIKKPSLETVIASGGKFSALLLNIYPGIFYKNFKWMKKSGLKKLELYRAGILKTTG